VREGDIVEEGQVLVARLDPTDFEIALEDRQASLRQLAAQLSAAPRS
jgi:multidrug resistance efflux pump